MFVLVKVIEPLRDPVNVLRVPDDVREVDVDKVIETVRDCTPSVAVSEGVMLLATELDVEGESDFDGSNVEEIE